ncbi:hypothetical protein [Actinoplanes regularis]|uniref:Uncharacterized protein n=1 Tax=Actinoplanes regularis TaxID=52697 RepID=A0A239BCM4_9ACTN|nr:hypothetical protein [Actinoplanes regularis]GIE87900.1 hypothetical protein Are01nite_43800 [Actinoplanes regularis]SNS05311.1 hypothetical protein SAMN06264365_109102 [Actinoplanes regularis]
MTHTDDFDSIDPEDLDPASADLDDWWDADRGNDPAFQPRQHWWPHLIDHINHAWITRRPLGDAVAEALAIPPKPATAVILAILATLAAGVVALIGSLIAALTGAIAGIADAVNASSRTGTADTTRDLVDGALTRTITDPVHTYLTQHAASLPATGQQIWTAWLVTTGILFALAAVGSRGARIGWTLTGALTTAMAYAGTDPAGRPIAAGLTAIAWALLSVIAFNRFTGTSRPVLHLSLPTRRQTTRDHDED